MHVTTATAHTDGVYVMMNGLLTAWMRFAETLVTYTLGVVLVALFLAVCYAAYTPRAGRTWRVAGAGGSPVPDVELPAPAPPGAV